jgi:hypothetical protein
VSSTDRARIERAVRTAAWKARLAADPTILRPIPRDVVQPARIELLELTHARGIPAAAPWRGALRAWTTDRWPLARAYVMAEIYRTPRTLERCASLAFQAAARLGASIVES